MVRWDRTTSCRLVEVSNIVPSLNVTTAVAVLTTVQDNADIYLTWEY